MPVRVRTSRTVEFVVWCWGGVVFLLFLVGRVLRWVGRHLVEWAWDTRHLDQPGVAAASARRGAGLILFFLLAWAVILVVSV